jgi:hypothetical protein
MLPFPQARRALPGAGSRTWPVAPVAGGDVNRSFYDALPVSSDTDLGYDPVALSRVATPEIRKDLDDFLYEIAKKYFPVYRTRINRR